MLRRNNKYYFIKVSVATVRRRIRAQRDLWQDDCPWSRWWKSRMAGGIKEKDTMGEQTFGPGC